MLEKDYVVAFAGSDVRSKKGAHIVSTAISGLNPDEKFRGAVIRGTPAMPEWARLMGWPIDFIPTDDNSVDAYARAIIKAFQEEVINCVIPMPEGLLFKGIVDKIKKAGFGNKVIGLTQRGSFLEGDKLACKDFCSKYGIPVAHNWERVDLKEYWDVFGVCADYLRDWGGAVLKNPYGVGGKGARIILDPWEIRKVYDLFMEDYKDGYKRDFGRSKKWPLLIESRMAAVEFSAIALIDENGSFQMLPSSKDYPERFADKPASHDNPITGGMGAIAPHPMWTPEVEAMLVKDVIRPLIRGMKSEGILRPCLIYPGYFVYFNPVTGDPLEVRVSEINIRPPEPEAQPVFSLVRNLGALFKATVEGKLDQVKPEIRENQISICIALITGPGGPDGQKGYPWSCTKGELVEVDVNYFKKQKSPQLMFSAAEFKNSEFLSDGTRVAYLGLNGSFDNTDPNKGWDKVATRMCDKMIGAFDDGKIRVIPRKNEKGNRLDIRRDVGSDFWKVKEVFPFK